MPATFDAVSGRVVLVVVPAAQIHGVALARRLGHTHDVDEEIEALLRLRRQRFQMAQMGQVERTDSGLRLSYFSAARAALRMLRIA